MVEQSREQRTLPSCELAASKPPAPSLPLEALVHFDKAHIFLFVEEQTAVI